MSNEYGTKIANALRAVRQMHADTSKLLQDCDGTIGKGKQSVYGNYATRDLTYSVRADQWMAEGVYRFYHDSDDPGLVEGITAVFIGINHPLPQPLLIVGQIKYYLDGDNPIKQLCKEWDLWHAFFTWSDNQELNKLLSPKCDDNGRVEWVKLIAAPLFDIKSMATVEELASNVRGHRV